MFGADARLARQNLGCHLGNTLILLHKLAFPGIFGPTKPLLSRVGDRQPVRQTLIVPQRQRLGLVVDLPLHRSLTSWTRYNDTNSIVAHITSTTTPLPLAATHPSILFYPYRLWEAKRRGSCDG